MWATLRLVTLQNPESNPRATRNFLKTMGEMLLKFEFAYYKKLFLKSLNFKLTNKAANIWASAVS